MNNEENTRNQERRINSVLQIANARRRNLNETHGAQLGVVPRNAFTMEQRIDEVGIMMMQLDFLGMEGLDVYQIRGMREYNLTRGQVISENFGSHTIDGLFEITVRDATPQARRAAFETLQGLDPDQVRGIALYHLTRNQVTSENFRPRFLDAIDQIIEGDRTPQATQEAYRVVQELSDNQVDGIVQFGLTLVQVQSPSYNKNILKAMEVLRAENLDPNNLQIYNTALTIIEHQIRGLSLGLSLAQVGYTGSVQDQKDLDFRGGTVNTIELLMNQDTNLILSEAYNSAMKLNKSQTNALDYGLRWNQVQDVILSNNKGAQKCEQLLTIVRGTVTDDEDFDIPLLKEHQNTARKVFDLMLTHRSLNIELLGKHQGRKEINKDEAIVVGGGGQNLEEEHSETTMPLKTNRSSSFDDNDEDKKPAVAEVTPRPVTRASSSATDLETEHANVAQLGRPAQNVAKRTRNSRATAHANSKKRKLSKSPSMR